jgi:hypothetical protein
VNFVDVVSLPDEKTVAHDDQFVNAVAADRAFEQSHRRVQLVRIDTLGFRRRDLPIFFGKHRSRKRLDWNPENQRPEQCLPQPSDHRPRQSLVLVCHAEREQQFCRPIQLNCHFQQPAFLKNRVSSNS